MILNEDAIRETINASVYDAFGEGTVASVDVEFLDDVEPMKDVISIRIVLNSEVERRTVSTLGLTLRKTLSDLKVESFPLVSMISKGDLARSHR